MPLVAVPHTPLVNGNCPSIQESRNSAAWLPISLSRLMGTVFGLFSAFDRGVGKDLLFIVDRGLLVFSQSHVDLFSQASLSIVTQLGRKSIFRNGQAFAKEIREKKIHD